MKKTGSKFTVTHLDKPVSVQILRTLMPWHFFSRRIFLSVLGIMRFEEQGAFDEPATYMIVARKFGDYQLFKKNKCDFCSPEENK